MTMIMRVFVVLLVVLQLCSVVLGSWNSSKTKSEQWCPPTNFLNLRKKIVPTFKVAIISEIHGQWIRTGLDWGTFHPPNLLARWCYHHLVVMGLEKLYLNVLYNESIYTTPPTPEDIYPHHQSCVVDWFKLDLLHWRTIPFASKNISTWPVDIRRKGTKKPSLHKDLWKSLKSINPTYTAISSNYDWVLVSDVDEYLLPLNWDRSIKTRWCKNSEPTLLTMILQSMLRTATNRVLYQFGKMNQSRELTLTTTQCPLGQSMQEFGTGAMCRPIAAFIMPERAWMNPKGTDMGRWPTLRGRYHTIYPDTSHRDVLSQAQEWKSIHCVAVTPELSGTTTYHYNAPMKHAGSVLAPREYHIVSPTASAGTAEGGGERALSMEIAHFKSKCLNSQCHQHLVEDNILELVNHQAIATCSK